MRDETFPFIPHTSSLIPFLAMAKRVLVVDDDREIVRLVQGYLRQAGYEVLGAYDGHTAVSLLLTPPVPDLLILDLMLPDQDGWQITQKVRQHERLRALPIIMLTARVDDVDKIVGLEMGADDYITKPFNPREVVARVRALLRRQALDVDVAGGGGNTAVLTLGQLHLDLARRQAKLGDTLLDLTPTEFELLHLLMENPGYAFTRDELIERGLGYSYEGLGRTLDSHIKNLRRKIEPDPKNPTYIQTVYGIGYRMSENE
jgi:two-component system, OmpR family, alkaline phosphatase synthesis response regulator PhoP